MTVRMNQSVKVRLNHGNQGVDISGCIKRTREWICQLEAMESEGWYGRLNEGNQRGGMLG